MKNKSMLIVIALCAGLQSGVIFSGQSWSLWDYFKGWGGQKTGEPTGARQTQGQFDKLKMAVGAAKLKLGQWNREGDVALAKSGAVTKALYSGIGAIMPMILTDAIGLLTRSGILPYGNLLRSGAYVIRMNSVLFCQCSMVISSLVTYKMISYGEGYITFDNAVKDVKGMLAAMLSDNLAYPTRSSKIHALLKKNEWYFDKIGEAPQTDTAVIIDQACRELIDELSISKVTISKEREAEDSNVDKVISSERAALGGFYTLDDQIKKISEDSQLKLVLELLEKPEIKAKLSVYLRLMKQQMVEKSSQGTFEKTSAAVQFYKPTVSKEEAEGIAQRKQGMVSSAEWLKQLEQNRQQEKEQGQQQEQVQ